MAEDSGEVVREAQEAVSAVDVQVKGNGPAFLQNISYQNAVNFQQAMNTEILRQSGLNAAIYGKISDMVINTQPPEAVGDSAIAEILSKIGGNTPPVTP